mgnify:CR=1 FL=1
MQNRTDWHFSGRSWLIIDAVIAWIAVLLAYSFGTDLVVSWDTTFPNQPAAYPAAIGFTFFFILIGNIWGLHDPLRQKRFWPVLARVVMVVSISIILFLLFLYLFWLKQLGRTTVITIAISSTVLSMSCRFFLWKISQSYRRKLLLLMNDDDRRELINALGGSALPFEIVNPKDLLNKADMGDRAKLLEVCRKLKVDEIIVNNNYFSGKDQPWLVCFAEGIQVTSLNTFIERYFYKVSTKRLGINWLLELDLRLTHPVYHRWKRVSDIIMGTVGLVLTAPLMIVVMVMIYLESGAPIFYTQNRVGLRGKVFTIWKLRTMKLHAEGSGSKWTQKKDSRVTSIGQFLRRTRFDEIPQFWNIIVGDMSMIGPRPEWKNVADVWTDKIDLYPYRNLVKPGLTGWAQINYPYAITEEDVKEKLSYDFYYMKHATVLLDFQIVLRTIAAIMKGSR